ncbi:MAG TPA: hypothetical protein EYO90_11315 [Candidatus Latescibacteria bacterium]|nr:hypothetical protein [Candidatus Latescibacterota bacterium]
MSEDEKRSLEKAAAGEEAGWPSLELLDKQTQGDLMVHWLQAGTGDDDKTISSTGRSPHAGDSMSARDLDGILSASERAGIKRFLFHPDPDLGAAEWRVISQRCGTAWKEDSSGSYWPPDTPGPDTAWFSGHA